MAERTCSTGGWLIHLLVGRCNRRLRFQAEFFKISIVHMKVLLCLDGWSPENMVVIVFVCLYVICTYFSAMAKN